MNAAPSFFSSARTISCVLSNRTGGFLNSRAGGGKGSVSLVPIFCSVLISHQNSRTVILSVLAKDLRRSPNDARCFGVPQHDNRWASNELSRCSQAFPAFVVALGDQITDQRRP